MIGATKMSATKKREWVTIKEVSEKTGLSRFQVQRLVHDGRLTSRNFPGTRPVVLASEIDRINRCVRTAETHA
jgi:excisionase family DNA binding protein